MNILPLLHRCFWLIEIYQVKYLNIIIEQNHGFIKTAMRPLKASNPFNQRQ